MEKRSRYQEVKYRTDYSVLTNRTAVVHESRIDPNRDIELEKLAFIVEVRDAIASYGANVNMAMVFNMDENPVTLLDAPVTAVVDTNSNQAAKSTSQHRYKSHDLLPHTHTAPSAWILDSYRAHFTPAVQEA